MANKLTQEQLEELVYALSWNDGYGCYTRAGFEKTVWPLVAEEAQWIIFFDVDDMHRLNTEHGYEGVNAIIKKSLAMRASDVMAGQWFSGDEFIVCISDAPGRQPSNPIEFSLRLAESFIANGASATFAIAPVNSKDLFANVEPAHKLCQQAKANGRRGSINIVEGDHMAGLRHQFGMDGAE